ncbi:MAG TPA: protein-L-isoaspartate(D-aspartate) O-methyltransferase [Candidatus Omnitrophica bacterium]|nr:protein-L-isoaspartate(D-aspartate) O-methyltransferase [Candidatus Omnitrophota bacterium]
MNENNFKKLRKEMVEHQIFKRGIADKKILDAFLNVPRHLFVSPDKRNLSYQDFPLPIGWGQTISQPFMVALMTFYLKINGEERVLEIGTGSGYQAAILSYLGAQVYSVERILPLAERAREILDSLGYKVKIKVGDGTLGWPECAPYDRIIVTAASFDISPCWVEQLKIGGRIVLPLGNKWQQELVAAERISSKELKKETVCSCVFVPLIGRYGFKE